MGRQLPERSIAERNALVEGAMEAIRNVAFMVIRRFCANVEVDDLIQQGALGAMQAAEKFDASLGIPFEAFAYQRIRGSMYDSLRRGKFRDLAMLSTGELLGATNDEFDDFASENVNELQPLNEDEIIADIDNQRRLKRIARAMASLPPRQRKVVAIHYVEGRTLREAGDDMGVSAPRAAQIRSEAIATIRSVLSSLRDVA